MGRCLIDMEDAWADLRNDVDAVFLAGRNRRNDGSDDDDDDDGGGASNPQCGDVPGARHVPCRKSATTAWRPSRLLRHDTALCTRSPASVFF